MQHLSNQVWIIKIKNLIFKKLVATITKTTHIKTKHSWASLKDVLRKLDKILKFIP